MKHIVYLDQRHLFSFYSQAYGGLEQTRVVEDEKSVSTETEKTPRKRSINKNASLGIPSLFGVSGDFMEEQKYVVETFGENEVSKEIVTQSLYDNALDLALDFARRNDLLYAAGDARVGQYVLLTGEYRLIDWDYFIGVLSGESLNFMLSNVRNTPAEEEMKSNLSTALNLFEFLKRVVPYDSLILLDKTVIPMKRDSFIENPGALNYAYGSSITVFGRISKVGDTAKIAKGFTKEKFTYDTVVKALNVSTDAVLANWGLPAINNAVTVVPIAAFFE